MNAPAQLNPALAAAAFDYNPALVAVDEDAIKALPIPVGLKGISTSLDGEMGTTPDLFIPYFVAMNTLNFQFWDLKDNGSFVRYEHEGKVGALAMQAGFLKAWREALGSEGDHEPMVRSMLAAVRLGHRIRMEGVRGFLGNIPQAEARRARLLEVLEPTTLRRVAAAFRQRCETVGQLSWRDALALSQNYPLGYADRYLKKAQLTLMLVAGQYQHPELGRKVELDVSAAADYQLPKVLRTLGLLTYDPELAIEIDCGILVYADTSKERAIRAATIRACDLLAKHFDCTVEQVDFWLWLNRNADKDAKFHLTRTTAY